MAKLLIIDDDVTFLETLESLLENYGFSVLTACNGEKGVESAQTIQPSLILCDINMPGLNGFEVYQKLQATHSTQTIPFIFLTGREDLNSFRQAMQLGANDYLTKPFIPEDLLNAVNIRLRQRQTLERKYESTLTLLRTNITYSLPHELRTPLTSIMGYGALLQADYKTMDRAEIGMFADEIVKGGQRLHRVIENYLVYTQLEILSTNKKEVEALRRHLVLADKVIQKFAEETLISYERYSDLILNVSPNLGLRISEDNLGKIITEIVDNSCRYSKPGTPIRIHAYRRQENTVIEIEDKGRGMAQEEISNIGAFMQFERGIYEQQGMGLGLSIAIKLCELHNGTLHLNSQKNVGTFVKIEFNR